MTRRSQLDDATRAAQEAAKAEREQRTEELKDQFARECNERALAVADEFNSRAERAIAVAGGDKFAVDWTDLDEWLSVELKRAYGYPDQGFGKQVRRLNDGKVF